MRYFFLLFSFLVCFILIGCTSGPSDKEILNAVTPVLKQQEQMAGMLMFGQGKVKIDKIDVESVEKLDDNIYKTTLIVETVVNVSGEASKKVTTRDIYKLKKVDAEWEVVKNLGSETISEE